MFNFSSPLNRCFGKHLKIATSKRFFSVFDVAIKNHQVRLAVRPVGLPTLENWKFTEEPIEALESKDDGIIVKVSTISLDPAMRGWMNDAKSYIPPVGIGEVMRAIGIGEVIESNNPKYSKGDRILGTVGVQEYATIQHCKHGVTKLPTEFGTDGQWLNVLGMPGMTGYFGLKEVGLAKEGETIVVSAAAGAVGQTVGQLAKIYGLKVVGIAGGKEKCDWVVDTLGFDSCIDYKDSSMSIGKSIRKHAPDGVDIYFDNVGGDILDSVLTCINKNARIVLCGAISQYNNEVGVVGPKNYLSLLVNRARMEGMVVFDYQKDYPVAVEEMSAYLKDKKMISKEHVVDGGCASFPDALTLLFTGGNFGKLILKM